MDMTLSKRGDYVVRSAISLARAYDEGVPRKIREVVADTSVPQTFASQILADLVKAGLAQSRAGRDGGYRLSRDPADISVLEVIEAAEGPLRAERCALGEGPCRWDDVCPLHETWSQATVVLREVLSEASLAELAERDEALEKGVYVVPVDAHRSHPVAVVLNDVVQVEVGDALVNRALGRAGSRPNELLLASLGEAPTVGGAGSRGAKGAGRSRGGADAIAEVSLVPMGPRTGTKSRDVRYLLAWQLVGPPATRFEGELTVEGLDDERSEVHVEGTWRQMADGHVVGAQELERSARKTLRAFLRELAVHCEREAEGKSTGGRARTAKR